MASIEAEWFGLKALYDSLADMAARADTGAKRIVAEGAVLVINKAQHNFDGSHKKGQPHVGGDKPNVVSGYLRRSIIADPIVKVGIGQYATTVGPTAVYGRRVELGFQGSKAYPYFGPAVREVLPDLVELQQTVFAEVIG